LRAALKAMTNAANDLVSKWAEKKDVAWVDLRVASMAAK